MNFLAHSILSFSDEQIVGNLIGDFIKNRDKKKLPEKIQQGVMMHRAIDAFTDVHPKVSEAKTVFQPLVRLYSGAFVDVVFDCAGVPSALDAGFDAVRSSGLYIMVAVWEKPLTLDCWTLLSKHVTLKGVLIFTTRSLLRE